MKEYLDDLVRVMTMNRQRYGKAWRKVRLIRVPKLLPELSEEQAFAVVRLGIELELLETCDQLVDGQMVPSIKLTKFPYVRRHLTKMS